MTRLFLLALAAISLFAESAFESSLTCKTCHPIIYDEFYDSSHRKSSIYTDAVHKAVWDKHPLKEKEQYRCAECHTPTDTPLLQALDSNMSALPQANNAQMQEGISCIYCHRIQEVEKHAKHNKNILSAHSKRLFSARKEAAQTENLSYKIESSFFGLVTKKSGSPFHDIDFSNSGFYDGKMCMGCHSHKQNAGHFDICAMEIDEKDDKAKHNCITCHMPLVQGSFTTATDSKTHRYHGFSGTSHKPQMLSDFVTISLAQKTGGFEVALKNEANHQLLLHPLRVGELQVIIYRGDTSIVLDPVTFMRIIGKDGKPSMPWVADSVLHDSHVKAKETRRIPFNTALEKGDIIEVKLGHYNVNAKAAGALGLGNNSDESQFTLFKKERFTIGATK